MMGNPPDKQSSYLIPLRYSERILNLYIDTEYRVVVNLKVSLSQYF